MLKRYKMISIIYGGSGAKYAEDLNKRIVLQSGQNRYPLSSMIVLESILTGDLLTNVVKLFADSEVCVAFLTADDCCVVDGQNRSRLRQNVVFELGMAVFQLGRERCILLSDFDPNDRNVELPSDLNGIDIKSFTPETQDRVFQDVLNKILQLSRSSVRSEEVTETIPQYDHLLDRQDYFIDYETLFASCDRLSVQEGSGYLMGVLEEWKNECMSFRHYEERCIYFFERIGFLPIFGKHDWVYEWCDACEDLLRKFNQSDIAYCGIRKLKFIQNLAYAVSGYTKRKLDTRREPGLEDYEELLNQLEMEPCDRSGVTNPLVITVYYDYLGLVYLRLYDHSGDREYLVQAAECFERVMQNCLDRVDMSLSIWTGFVAYNLARCYLKLHGVTGNSKYAEDTQRLLSRATFVRKKWLSVSGFNATVRSALSYEYFICKIEQISAARILGCRSNDAVRQDYKRLEGELESYLSKDEQLERLRFVQKLLDQRQTELV